MTDTENIDYLRECFLNRYPFIVIELPTDKDKPLSDYKKNLLIDEIRTHSRAILIEHYPAVLNKSYTRIKYQDYDFTNAHKIVFIDIKKCPKP